MTRTLFCGDPHAKPRLLTAVTRTADRERADRIVILGDLCDDWNVSARINRMWADTLAAWAEDERARREIVLLAGNHDIPYLMPEGVDLGRMRTLVGLPGHTAGARRHIRGILQRLDLRLAWTDGLLLATHAGVTATWARAAWEDGADARTIADDLNARLASPARLRALYCAVGSARGGDATPGPLWADRRELARDPPDGPIQIVGHTPVPTVTREHDTWLCDTWSTLPDGTPIGDGTMLAYDDRNGTFDVIRP